MSIVPRKKKSTLEIRDIEKPVVAYGRSLGFWARKTIYVNRRSSADYTFRINGYEFVIEFKRPGLHPTALQEEEHASIRRAGGTVYVIDSVDVGKRLLHWYNGLPVRRNPYYIDPLSFQEK